MAPHGPLFRELERDGGRCPVPAGNSAGAVGTIPAVVTVRRAAPILPVRDVDAALAFYDRLGFTTLAYEGGGYGFATRDRAEIHLGAAPGGEGPADQHSAYLFVDDADALAREWQAAGVEVVPPERTPWGMHEGRVVDPDGNVLRFGSPLRRRRI